MEFSRLGYWSGLPNPSPPDLPGPGIELGSPALQGDSLPTELSGKPLVQWSHLQYSEYDINIERQFWEVALQ